MLITPQHNRSIRRRSSGGTASKRVLYLFVLTTDDCVSSYIRRIEYSDRYSRLMPESLRRFKADVFQALAHPTRIAIIELLGQGELSAGELMAKLGMEQANVSQHLTVLRAKRLVINRKEGNQVFYAVRDPIINKVLALMRRYFQRHLKESLNLLDELGSSAELKK